MNQRFVYHPLERADNSHRPHAATASEAVTEYLAYIAMLSIAVVIAIITFAYAANITVRWLDTVVKPSFLASDARTAAASKHLAMLPATVPFKFKNNAIASE